LEHYLGISLFPTSKTIDRNKASELVKMVADYLSGTALGVGAS
jgi:hypothetical protein